MMGLLFNLQLIKAQEFKQNTSQLYMYLHASRFNTCSKDNKYINNFSILPS